MNIIETFNHMGRQRRSFRVLNMLNAHAPETPLDFDLFKSYINRGINMGVQDVIGTPLHNAIQAKHLDAALLLIDHGADVNFKCDTLGKTPLILSVLADTTLITLKLLSHGANPNIQDQSLSSALHYAVLYGRTDIIQPLIMAGADPTLKDNAHKSVDDYKKGRNFLYPETEKAFDDAIIEKTLVDEKLKALLAAQKEFRIKESIQNIGTLTKPLRLHKKARFRKG